MYSHYDTIDIFISIEIRLLNINKMAPKVKVGTELLIKFLNPVSARQLKIICYKILRGMLYITVEIDIYNHGGSSVQLLPKMVIGNKYGIILGD